MDGMKASLMVCVGFLAGASSCGVTPTYEVRVVGATLGPGKSDGTQWDCSIGTCGVTPEILTNLAQTLAGPEAGLVVKVGLLLSGDGVQALGKPDAFGTAELNAKSLKEALKIGLGTEARTEVQDNFQPVWAQGTLFTKVPLDDDLRININLTDADIQNNDDIGQVELNKKDLQAALDANGVYQVPVFSQSPSPSRPQIIFIGISVRKE